MNMVDFRKLLSPKSRAEVAEQRNDCIAFQQQDAAGMAQSLVEASRKLIDSGLFKEDPRWSYDEWMIYRCIPALAKRLDPNLELRSNELGDAKEKEDPLTSGLMESDEKLETAIASVLSYATLSRAGAGPKEVRRATDLLIGYRKMGSAVSVAMDTISPGSYPARVSPDRRPALTGVQLIASHGDHDRVMRYAETEEELDELYRAALAKRSGEELTDDEQLLCSSLRGWPERLDFDTLSIQTWDGEVLRACIFLAEETAEPTM